MSQFTFEEEDHSLRHLQEQPAKPDAFKNFLYKIGLPKDERIANKVMLISSIVIFVTSLVIFAFNI